MATRESGLGGVIYVSAARTADPTSVVLSLPVGHKGLLIVVDVTATSVTPSVVPTVRVLDVNGDYNAAIYTGTAFTATGEFTYLMHPGTIAADFDGTDAVSFGPPADFDLFMNHADADSITYSVQVHFLR